MPRDKNRLASWSPPENNADDVKNDTTPSPRPMCASISLDCRPHDLPAALRPMSITNSPKADIHHVVSTP